MQLSIGVMKLIGSLILTTLPSVASRALWSTNARPNLRRTVSEIACTILEADVQHDPAISPGPEWKGHEWRCKLDPKDADGFEDITVELDGITEDFVKEHSEDMKSGEATMIATGATMVDDKLILPSEKMISVEKIGKGKSKGGKGKGKGKGGKGKGEGGKGKEAELNRKRNRDERRLAIKSIGTSTVLVLRVIAADAATTKNAAQLSEDVFGGPNDSVNLKSQYGACSYNKLNFIKATGSGINNGVAEISITQNIQGVNRGTVVNYVTAAAQTALGTALNSFDHVMFCLPPGTSGNWIAYAFYNNYESVYNDDWCSYVSGQMHEVGHNLNMRHSGQGGNSYGDQSGMMGLSYSNDESPIMCFNAAKSSQLGWYSDKEVTVEPVQNSWSGKLIGVADYGNAGASHSVILQIVRNQGNNLFLTYNTAKGINSGTEEFAGEVTVVTGSSTQQSNHLASLTVNQDYVISNFDGTGNKLTILVSSTGQDANSVDFAEVSAIYDGSPIVTPSPQQPSTPAPQQPVVTPAPQPGVTPAPVTPAPQPAPVTPSPNGDSCGNCLVASNPRTGCENAACEAVICALDPWCCSSSWDQLCVNRVLNGGCTCNQGSGPISPTKAPTTAGTGAPNAPNTNECWVAVGIKDFSAGIGLSDTFATQAQAQTFANGANFQQYTIKENACVAYSYTSAGTWASSWNSGFGSSLSAAEAAASSFCTSFNNGQQCAHLESMCSACASSAMEAPLAGAAAAAAPEAHDTVSSAIEAPLAEAAAAGASAAEEVRDTCTGDEDCIDGTVCNGRERCLDGMCLPGFPLECSSRKNPNSGEVASCDATRGCVFSLHPIRETRDPIAASNYHLGDSTCGDAYCADEETSECDSWCETDCGPKPLRCSCGNEVCDAHEDKDNCRVDCHDD